MDGSPVTLEVYDPCSSIEATQDFAPRLDTLAGKTICEITNASWEDHRTFSLIREQLQKRFPDVRIIPFTEFPQGSRNIDADSIGELVKAKGADAAIVGNAG